MAVQAGLGFSAGVPLLMTGQLLGLWFADLGSNIQLFAASLSIGLPYTLKFCWAPLFDAFALPFLGRRRGWILFFQLALAAALAAMAGLGGNVEIGHLFVAGIVVATLSASQDVVVDALRADLLPPEQRSAGAAMYMMGYRAAMLLTGTVGLVLSDHVEWRFLYAAAGGLMLLCVPFTLLAEEPTSPSKLPRIDQSIVRPFVDLVRRFDWTGALIVLLFAATYKFGDQLIDGFTGLFYTSGTKAIPAVPNLDGLRFWLGDPFVDELHRVFGAYGVKDIPAVPGLGFSRTVLGTYTKFAGVTGLFLGGLLATWLSPRLGLRKALVIYGVVQAASNFAYVGLTLLGKNYLALGAAIVCDYTANTLGTAAFLSLFAAVTSKEVSATQYALLSSLSSVGKRVFGWWGGAIIADAGWRALFMASAAIAIPGILLVFLLPRRLFDRPTTSAPG